MPREPLVNFLHLCARLNWASQDGTLYDDTWGGQSLSVVQRDTLTFIRDLRATLDDWFEPFLAANASRMGCRLDVASSWRWCSRASAAADALRELMADLYSDVEAAYSAYVRSYHALPECHKLTLLSGELG